MRTSWKAKSTGNQKFSSSDVGFVLPDLSGDFIGDLRGDFNAPSAPTTKLSLFCDSGHSGVLSMRGMMDLSASSACRLFFWKLRFLEKAVRHTMRSVNAPCEMTTPNLVLYTWLTFSHARLTMLSCFSLAAMAKTPNMVL